MYNTILGIIYFVAMSHGLMLSVALWNKSRSGTPSRWLAVIALLISYKLFEGGLLYTELFPHMVHTMDLLPGEVLIIGPLLFIYTRLVAGYRAPSKLGWLLHLIPAISLWLLNASSVFQSAANKIAMWQHVLSADVGQLPIKYIVLLLAIKAHLSLYLFLSWRTIATLNQASDNLRADHSQAVLKAMKFLVIGFFILELVWVGLFIAQQFFAIGALNNVSNTWLLLVAFMVLSIGYIGLQQPSLVFTSEERLLAEQYAHQPENEQANVKYLHSALPESTGEQLAKAVEQQIQRQQLYLNEKLTLTDLAKATDIKAHTLSQVINQSMKTSFYKLINGYRIQHAVSLIDDNHNNWSLERIAYESGFSNRVTFSKAFKEIMSSTPSAYKKQAQQAG